MRPNRTPLRQRVDSTLSQQGASGIMSVTGEAGGSPVKAGVPVTEGMSRALLKFNGGSVHDYATIADDFPRPSRASRARRAATSVGIS